MAKAGTTASSGTMEWSRFGELQEVDIPVEAAGEFDML
jgi:hypothetical protein